MPRPLTLDTNGCAAQRGNQDPEDVGCDHGGEGRRTGELSIVSRVASEQSKHRFAARLLNTET
jgi:hypothetical protein